jgi:hypothetical protein
MENPEKIIQKIENGEARVRGVNVQPSKKLAKSVANAEGAAHHEETKKADEQAKAPTSEKVKKPKAQKAPKEPKAPEELKVAEFPFQTTINAYGFIGLGKDELRAIGLSVVEEKGAKEKLKAAVPITFSAWNPEKRELTVKVS